jgi:hypothetical protein
VTDIYPSPATKEFEKKRRNDPRYAQAMLHLSDLTPTDDVSFRRDLFETLVWYVNDPGTYVPVLKKTLAWIESREKFFSVVSQFLSSRTDRHN